MTDGRSLSQTVDRVRANWAQFSEYKQYVFQRRYKEVKDCVIIVDFTKFSGAFVVGLIK